MARCSMKPCDSLEHSRNPHPETPLSPTRERGTTHSACIIGFGNPLRQDDGFGWRVAERLIEAPTEAIQVITCPQLVPELAEPLSHCHLAIFVDAREGEPVGELEWQALSFTPSTTTSFTHSLCPADLCLMAQILYGSAPAQAYLLTVRSVHFDHREGLSPEVERAVERAAAQIASFCADRGIIPVAPRANGGVTE